MGYWARMLSVTSTNELSAIFIKLNFCVMSFDIPVETYTSSLHMYYLNVAPLQHPIFCICVLLYPTRAWAFAPPLHREWVLMRLVGIPFISR